MEVKEEKILTVTQEQLIRAMVRARRPQTAYKIGKRAGRTWKTAKDNLEILKRKNVVAKKKKKGVSIWSLN